MKKALLSTGILTILLVLGGIGWWRWANTLPTVEPQKVKMPSSNAFDFYLKASQAITVPQTVIDPIHDSKHIPQAQWKTHYPIAKKEAWLRQNAKALQLVHQGLQCRYYAPQHYPLQKSTNDTTTLRPLLWVMRLLVIESRVDRERGAYGKAASSLLDVQKIGQDILRGGHIGYYIFSSAFNSVAYRELWEVIPHLSSAEAQAARKRLEQIYSDRVQFADLLKTDKYFNQLFIIERFYRAQSMQETPLKALILSIAEPRRKAFQNYTAYVDTMIAQAQKPYATTSVQPSVPDDAFSRTYAPVYQRARWNYARVETKTVFLITALALQAFKQEQKRYPQKLEELAPRYLAKVPADPYGRGEGLYYRQSGAHYTLYSISADGINDNGRPTQAASKSNPKDLSFILTPDSKGDFVAGINY